MTHDNHEADIFNCPVDGCNLRALNKGIIETNDPKDPETRGTFRNVFCLEHKNQFVPIEKASKAISRLEHEFVFYKGTHLERTYQNVLPHKHDEYLKIQSKKNTD